MLILGYFSVNSPNNHTYYNKLPERLSYISYRNKYYIFMSIFNTAIRQSSFRKAQKSREGCAISSDRAALPA